jgi:hypothetical protein
MLMHKNKSAIKKIYKIVGTSHSLQRMSLNYMSFTTCFHCLLRYFRRN